MKLYSFLLFSFFAFNASANESKKILCDSLKEKMMVFDHYGQGMRSYAVDYKNSEGYGTGVFEDIQFMAQCKNHELDLLQSLKYAAYANVMYFMHAKDIEEKIIYFKGEYLNLLHYISEYSSLTIADKEKILSFKEDLPILLSGLDELAQEFGSFHYSSKIFKEMGVIQERNSDNRIVVDCRRMLEGDCYELWYLLEKDNKRSVLNRMVLKEHKLLKKLMKYDKDYFKATEHFALWIYAAVASELIPYAPIILPIAIPGIIISGTIEGLRYVLVRKNHQILYKSTVRNQDKSVGKRKFNKLIDYVMDIQFHPFQPEPFSI